MADAKKDAGKKSPRKKGPDQFPVGSRVKHVKRGLGKVVSHTDDGKVAVLFDDGDLHRYGGKSLAKLAVAADDAAEGDKPHKKSIYRSDSKQLPDSPSGKREHVHAVPQIVKVDIIEGRDLKSMDSNGFSDPYVEVRLVYKVDDGLDRATKEYVKLSKQSTRVVKKTIHPYWDESMVFASDLKESDNMSLVVKCWDHDTSSFNDLIGKLEVPLADMNMDASKHDHGLVVHGWLPLKTNSGKEAKLGELHMRVECIFDGAKFEKIKAEHKKRMRETTTPAQRRSKRPIKWCQICHRDAGKLNLVTCKKCGRKNEWSCIEIDEEPKSVQEAKEGASALDDGVNEKIHLRDLHGYLTKKGKVGGKWQLRWIILDAVGGTVRYFQGRWQSDGLAKNVIAIHPTTRIAFPDAKWCTRCFKGTDDDDLKKCTRCMGQKFQETPPAEAGEYALCRGAGAPKELFYFTLVNDDRRDLHMAAKYKEDRDRWIKAMEAAIQWQVVKAQKEAKQAKLAKIPGTPDALRREESDMGSPHSPEEMLARERAAERGANSWGGDIKWCRNCGMGTKKPKRECCKKCTSREWTYTPPGKQPPPPSSAVLFLNRRTSEAASALGMGNTAAKWCTNCHTPTKKAEREFCKVCGKAEWSTTKPTGQPKNAQEHPLARKRKSKQSPQRGTAAGAKAVAAEVGSASPLDGRSGAMVDVQSVDAAGAQRPGQASAEETWEDGKDTAQEEQDGGGGGFLALCCSCFKGTGTTDSGDLEMPEASPAQGRGKKSKGAQDIATTIDV